MYHGTWKARDTTIQTAQQDSLPWGCVWAIQQTSGMPAPAGESDWWAPSGGRVSGTHCPLVSLETVSWPCRVSDLARSGVSARLSGTCGWIDQEPLLTGQLSGLRREGGTRDAAALWTQRLVEGLSLEQKLLLQTNLGRQTGCAMKQRSKKLPPARLLAGWSTMKRNDYLCLQSRACEGLVCAVRQLIIHPAPFLLPPWNPPPQRKTRKDCVKLWNTIYQLTGPQNTSGPLLTPRWQDQPSNDTSLSSRVTDRWGHRSREFGQAPTSPPNPVSLCPHHTANTISLYSGGVKGHLQTAFPFPLFSGVLVIATIE